MNEQEYLKKCEEVLGTPLSTDTPDALMSAAVEAESLGYLATKFQAVAEARLRKADSVLMVKKAECYPRAQGKTADDRKADVERMIVDEISAVAEQESLVKYYRNLSILIDRRVGLAQSTLANFSAQIKAGIMKF